MGDVKNVVLKPIPNDPIIDLKTGFLMPSWRVWFNELIENVLPRMNAWATDHIAVVDENGNIIDSGQGAEGFAEAVHGHTSDEDGGELDLTAVFSSQGEQEKSVQMDPDLWALYLGDMETYATRVGNVHALISHNLPYRFNELVDKLVTLGVITAGDLVYEDDDLADQINVATDYEI
jgi:hypothetical protein